MQSTEKQKSYARFVRKMIKKMNLWGSGELLLEKYPVFFEELLQAFAGMKKETAISSEVLRLYRLFFSKGDEKIRRVFVPEFYVWNLVPLYGGESCEAGHFRL